MPKGLFLHPQLQSSSACSSLTEQAELFSTGNLNCRYFFFYGWFVWHLIFFDYLCTVITWNTTYEKETEQDES